MPCDFDRGGGGVIVLALELLRRGPHHLHNSHEWRVAMLQLPLSQAASDGLDVVLRETSDAMLVLDAYGRVLAASQAAESLLGRPGGLVGQALDRFLSPRMLPLYRSALTQVESVGSVRATVEAAGGVTLELRLSMLPCEDGHRAILAVLRELGRKHRPAAAGTERVIDTQLGWLSGIMDHASVVIALKSPDGVYRQANRQLGLLLGLPRREILGKTDRDLFPADVADRLVAHDQQVRQAGSAMQFEERLSSPRGEQTYLTVKFPLYAANGELEGIGMVATDITELKNFQEQLAREREKAVVTLSSIGEGIIVCDPDGFVEYLNPMAEALTQYARAEAVGRPLGEVLRIMDELSRRMVDSACFWSQAGCRFGPEDHHVVIGRDGTRIPVQETASPIRDPAGQCLGAVIVLRDVSASRQLARRLSYEASHDPLTGLPNRAEFNRLLQQAIDDARQEGHRHALCYVDLDNFKPVNDQSGHAAGDELLRQLCARLKASLRQEDVLGRLGGDEFGVLLPHCDLKAAQRIAEGLRAAAESFRLCWDGVVHQVTTSIGVAPITADSGDFEAVRAAADEACYQAKQAGRNRVRVWGGGAAPAAAGERSSEPDWYRRLSAAMRRNGFRLFCQEIVDLQGQGRELRGEVLLRLKGKDGSLIPPGGFLPAATRYDLMAALDRWVVRQVFARVGRNGSALLTINLSAQALTDPGMADFLEDKARRYRVEPERFCFEFSETAVTANYVQAQRLLTRLRRLGYQLSLDHFGSGYASYDYLRRLPIDYLKIDGELVRDMCEDRLDYTMVESLNHIGHALGKRTIAGSAADSGIVAELRELGVDLAQGYALARPQPLEEFGSYR